MTEGGYALITSLRTKAETGSPVEVAECLEAGLGRPVSQGDITVYFKRAFPQLPLRVLIEAGAWSRLTDGELDDAGFNALLGPWLPRQNESHKFLTDR
jgi:hypothetical protein